MDNCVECESPENTRAKTHWTECRTLHELNDLERPDFTAWVRHLADLKIVPGVVPVVPAACAASA